MSSQVLLVQGSSIKISTNQQTTIPPVAATYATLDCLLRDVQLQGGAASEIDVTTLCSTAKEFRLGLQDSGNMTVTGHWKQGDAGHTAVRAAAADKLSRLIVVTFSDGSTYKSLAFVKQRSFSMAVDGVVTASYVFRLTGAGVEDDPSH